MMMMISVSVLLLIVGVVHCTTDFYSITVTTVNGEKQSLQQYRGKVLVIVNVASECGYTDYNYKQLVALQKQFSNDKFSILAFPCNEFGQQEPDSDSSIIQYVTDTYNINFNMFAKINITGADRSPVYQYLLSTTGSTPEWNFCKYLVNQNGNVVQFFTHTDDFQNILKSVKYLISKNTLAS